MVVLGVRGRHVDDVHVRVRDEGLVAAVGSVGAQRRGKVGRASRIPRGDRADDAGGRGRDVRPNRTGDAAGPQDPPSHLGGGLT